IRTGDEHSENGVPGFMIRDPLAVLARQEQRPLRPEHDLLERVEKVAPTHVVAVAARGEQRRLVREVAEIGAGETGRGGRELLEAHVRRERTLPRVDLQDLGAALLVREIHDEAAIEAARPKQRAIEHVRLIRRREHDDALAAREAVHLREYLIERLLLLGRRAAE